MRFVPKKRISELEPLYSASINTFVVGVDNGTTYKIETSAFSEVVIASVSASIDARLDYLEALSGSYNQFSNSYHIDSASFDDRIISITGSIGTTGPQGNQGVIGPQGQIGPQGEIGPQGNNGTSGTSGFSINSASFATTGSNTFNGGQTISGSVLISGSLEVNGVSVLGGFGNLQQILNNGAAASNYGGNGSASIQLTNFTNGRTLYVNNNNYPTIKMEDNTNAANNLTIDINTLTIDNVSHNWTDIVNQSTPTGSFATTGSNTFNGSQIVNSFVTASYFRGSGRTLTNLTPTTNWNYDEEYSVRQTEQLTFSGDYILENSYLAVLGGVEEIDYSSNKSFKKEGSIFIGGNLLVKDSYIENDGLISVGGEVILIGNSQITGTGIII